MKDKVVYLLSTLLTGCVYQSVPVVQIEIATEWCKDKGGIDRIASLATGTYLISCQQYKPEYLRKSVNITQELFRQKMEQ